MKDITKLTLGELLSSKDDTIKRNAMSILKQGQKQSCCDKPLLEIGNYRNGAKWLECINCYTAIKPLNKIAKEN